MEQSIGVEGNAHGLEFRLGLDAWLTATGCWKRFSLLLGPGNSDFGGKLGLT